MNFKIYDILSTLIPGFLVYSSILYILGTEFSDIPVVFATVFAYLGGYIINTLSSWIEPILYFTWGGKPSDNLLNGKDIWKVKFYDHGNAKNFLKKDCDDKKPSNDKLFQIAMRKSFATQSQRIEDFNSGFAFARSIFMSVLISAIILGKEFYCNYLFFVIAILLLIILWLRAKQKGYYFAREVLNTYLSTKS